MILRLMILVAVFSFSAQGQIETTTIAKHTTTTIIAKQTTTSDTTKTPTATTTLSSSSLSSSSSAALYDTSSSPKNCSAFVDNFHKIYKNASVDNYDCPPLLHINDTCVSTVNPDNCTSIVTNLQSTNSNLSFGLIYTKTGLQFIKWNCAGELETIRMINESNSFFCGIDGGTYFNCSVDKYGILRIQRVSVLDPLRKAKSCVLPTTGPPTIPLLPNPVGPPAITAIVVLVSLFITAVLAGFFFWPKCHMSKPPPPTPKKKPPTPEAINVVAYSSAGHSPTGAANVTISIGPNQIGPAA